MHVYKVLQDKFASSCTKWPSVVESRGILHVKWGKACANGVRSVRSTDNTENRNTPVNKCESVDVWVCVFYYFT